MSVFNQYKPKSSDIVGYIRQHYVTEPERRRRKQQDLKSVISPTGTTVSPHHEGVGTVERVGQLQEGRQITLPPIVATRNSKTYLTQISDCEGSWEDRHDRHKVALGQGYLTSCIEPFRPVGGGIQDIQHLLLYSLNESLSDKAKEELLKSISDVGKHVDDKSRRYSLATGAGFHGDQQHDISIEDNDFIPSAQTGMSQIRAVLRGTKRRRASVKCEGSYATMVRAEQEEQQLIQEQEERAESRGMVLSRLSSDYLCALPERVLTPDKRGKNSALKRNEKQLDEDGATKTLSRRARNYRKRLMFIHMLLMSLSNMRNKCLKSKTPLTWEFVKLLRKPVPNQKLREYDQRYSIVGNNHCIKVSASTISSNTDLNQLALSTPNTHLATPNNHLATSILNSPLANSSPATVTNRSSHASRHVPIAPSKLHVNQMVPPNMSTRGSIYEKDFTAHLIGGAAAGRIMRGRNKKPAPIRDDLKLETWEELCAVNPADKDYRRSKSHRKVPPWQQAISNERPKSKVENKDENGVVFLTTEEEDQGMRIKKQIEEFNTTKATAKKQIEKRLSKLDRQRMYTGKQKLGALNRLNPILSVQQNYMRDIAGNKSHLIHAVKSNIEKALWFQQIRTDIISMNLDEDEEVRRCLTQLERYAFEDLESSPMNREKLCLIVCSLPIHEICTVPLQNAIKFVLAEILQTDDATEILTRWLHYRNLYVISN